MITVKKETTITGLSELRNQSDKVLRHLKERNVILEKHHKPVAVMVDYKKHQAEEVMLDFAEDYILARLAEKRDRDSKPEDYVDIDKW